MTSEVKQQQIEWRRTRVLELSSEGYSRSEICQKLQLDKGYSSQRHPVLTTASKYHKG